MRMVKRPLSRYLQQSTLIISEGGMVPKSVMHTVWYRKENRCYKVIKIGFGGDGSYFVCAPYHPLNTAIVGKIRVNYARPEPLILSKHSTRRSN